MNTKLSTYFCAAVLGLFSNSAFSFDVSPANPNGDEGTSVGLNITVDSQDWYYYDNPENACNVAGYVFTINLSPVSGSAIWSDDAISGDFNLEQNNNPVSQQQTLIFCSADGVTQSFMSYGFNLHTDDVLDEGTETAVIQFNGSCPPIITSALAETGISGPNGTFGCPVNVSLSINDTTMPFEATISGTSGAEPDIDGSFTVSLNQPAGPNGLEIYYSVDPSSTATAGEDYQSLGFSVIVPPGATSVNIPVVVLDDDFIEGTETITVELNADGFEVGNPSIASIDIVDDDALPLVSISGTGAAEPGPPEGSNGSFTINLAEPAPSGGVTINYELSASSTAIEDEDFLAIGRTITIPANETSASIPLVVIDDELVEGPESVVVDILSSANYDLGSPSSVSVDISDDDTTPVVSISSARAAEPGPPDGNDGMFTISLDQPAPSMGLSISYSVSAASTATSGVDYEALSGVVDIPAGEDTAEIPVIVIDDDVREGSESVIVDLAAGPDYELSSNPSSTMFIVDDDIASPVTVSVSASNASEPSSNGMFTFSLASPAPVGGVTVNYTVLEGSTATDSSDYQSFATSVNIAAGSNTASVPVVVIDDDITEGPETVIVQLLASPDYEPGVPDSATLTIMDDDAAGLEVSTSLITVSEAGGTDQFTVALTAAPAANVNVGVSSSNTAEGIVEPANLVFTSANWSTPQVVTVTGVDDNVVDGNVDFNVTLTTSSSDSAFASIAPVQISATNHDDDEEPAVGFPQVTFTVTEDVGSAEVTIERVGASDDELTVRFTTDDNASGTTATAGVDYTPVDELLVWAANDNAPKTVFIQIDNDANNEGDETIVLKLEVVGSNAPVYADLVVSNDFVEDVIAEINPEDLPLNQQSITTVILTSCPTGQGVGGFQELCTDLVVEALEGGSVVNPLTQVTPDEAGAARTPATQGQTVQNINVTGRQSALRGGVSGLSMQGFSVNLAGFNMNTSMFQNFGAGYDSIQANATSPMAQNFMANNLNASGDDDNDFGKWGIWVSGKAVFGDKDATVNEQGFDFDTAGLTIGVDYRFTDSFVAGAAFGYADNSIKQDAKSGKLDTTGLTGTVYGSYYPSANFYMDASISFGNNDYKQIRNVNYVLNQIGASVDESFKADYSGDQTSITFGTGYDFNSNGWVFGPTLFVEYIDISVDGYDEKLLSSNNPNFTLGWATHINKQSYESLIPSIGGQISKAFSQSWGVIVPQAHVSWAKELKADGDIISGYFLGDTGQVQFSLLTDDLDDDFFKAGIGLSAMFQNNKSAFVSIDGDFGRDLITVYYINAGFRWEF